VSLVSINRLILFADIIIPASENHKKLINALYGTMQRCLTLQPAANIINTGPKTVIYLEDEVVQVPSNVYSNPRRVGLFFLGQHFA
jgi:hypothetical protein